jgi:hypothetical protein
MKKYTKSTPALTLEKKDPTSLQELEELSTFTFTGSMSDVLIPVQGNDFFKDISSHLPVKFDDEREFFFAIASHLPDCSYEDSGDLVQALSSLDLPSEENLSTQVLDSMEWSQYIYKGRNHFFKWVPKPEFWENKFLTPLGIEDLKPFRFEDMKIKKYFKDDPVVALCYNPEKTQCSLDKLWELEVYCAGIEGLFLPAQNGWVFKLTAENVYLHTYMTPFNVKVFTAVTGYAM